MSSKLLKLDPFAAAFERQAREEQEKKEKTSATPAPVESVAPAIIIAPVEFVAPVKSHNQPLQITGATDSTGGVNSKGAQLLPSNSPHLRAPHEIIDKVLPTLKPTSQSVLLRLYRLSAGFDSWTCKVSIPKLAIMCNISESQARVCIRDLTGRRLVRKIREDLSNPDQKNRGIEFEVLLPRLARANSTGAADSTGAAKSRAPVESAPNKEKDLKESNKKGSELALNPKDCPDCAGSGFWYPEGVEKGVAKCKHDKLTKDT